MSPTRSQTFRRTARRVAQAAVAAVVLAAVATAAPVPAGASASADGTPATSARAAVRTTSLTLAVRGCDGCAIQPVRAGTTATTGVWRGRAKKVRHGVVHWTVSLRHTVGMSFDITDPQAVNVGAIPDIVVAYRGLAVGDRVLAGVARHKKRANGCWAGTQRAAITLRVRVERFRTTSAFPPPVQGYSIRSYFVRTRAHLRLGSGAMYGPTFHGAIGNQDAYFCDV